MGTFVICWACHGLGSITIFFFFSNFSSKFFFGLFFLLEIRANKFFFFFFKFEGVPNTKKKKKKINYYIYIYFFFFRSGCSHHWQEGNYIYISSHCSFIYICEEKDLTMDSMPNKKKLHIAMFPWLDFGHMIPYLELAKLMAQKGHHISFLSTPQNIDRLPKLPPNLASLIDLVKLPYHTWKRTTSQKMPRPPLMSHITKSHTSRKHMMLFKTPWLGS